jgi:hypothetical protein
MHSKGYLSPNREHDPISFPKQEPSTPVSDYTLMEIIEG